MLVLIAVVILVAVGYGSFQWGYSLGRQVSREQIIRAVNEAIEEFKASYSPKREKSSPKRSNTEQKK